VYFCKRCTTWATEAALIEDRKKNAQKNIDLIAKFDDRLQNCAAGGVCDILAAHHDILKDDPERLSTDFLISLTCGEVGLAKYHKTKGAAP